MIVVMMVYVMAGVCDGSVRCYDTWCVHRGVCACVVVLMLCVESQRDALPPFQVGGLILHHRQVANVRP